MLGLAEGHVEREAGHGALACRDLREVDARVRHVDRHLAVTGDGIAIDKDTNDMYSASFTTECF